MSRRKRFLRNQSLQHTSPIPRENPLHALLLAVAVEIAKRMQQDQSDDPMNGHRSVPSISEKQ